MATMRSGNGNLTRPGFCYVYVGIFFPFFFFLKPFTHVSRRYQTLDALPAHLLTPFVGPVPPSNLLDKIARGVAQAKGTEEWPHSVRATRVKLMELARTRGKPSTATMATTPSTAQPEEVRRHRTIREEDEEEESRVNSGQPGFGVATTRRPLHQSNTIPQRKQKKTRKPLMNLDFIPVANRIALSVLPSHERTPQPTREAYPTDSDIDMDSTHASSSQPLPQSQPPRTISTSTLNSSASSTFDSTPTKKSVRGCVSSTFSETSNTSSQSFMDEDEKEQYEGKGSPMKSLRRTESFCAPSLSTMNGTDHRLGKKQSFKRAPAFGVVAGAYRQAAESGAPCAYPSSDEEEKDRNKQAKKVRRTKGLSAPVPSPDEPPPTPRPRRNTLATPPTPSIMTKPSKKSPFATATATNTPKQVRKPRMNLQRNPSIFGAPLPCTMPPPPEPRHSPESPSRAETNTALPETSKPKTLRRTKGSSSFAVNPRRISFNSLPMPGDDDDADFEGGLTELGGRGLESAFQLQ
jgi:transcription factor SPN1